MSPAETYRARLRDRQQSVHRLLRWDSRIAIARGLTFLATIVLIVALTRVPQLPEELLVLPVVVFWGLLAAHGFIRRRLERTERGVQHYQLALDRLKDRWQGLGTGGARYRDAAHPYANDLDLFGQGSLFQLISRCQTRVGEDCLARWLKAPADRDEILARQAAVAELAPQVHLREELQTLPHLAEETRDQNLLLRWCGQSGSTVSNVALAVSTSITLAGLAALVFRLTAQTPWSWVVAAVGVQIIIVALQRRSLQSEITTAEHAREGLRELAAVLKLLESQTHAAPRLKAIQDRLIVDGRPPSAQIRRLRGLADLLSNCLRNQFLAPLAVAVGLQLHLLRRLHVWRARVGSHVADWLRSVGEWESLLSLSGHAYEFPENRFPEIVVDELLFDSRALLHPILPRDAGIANDVRIEAAKNLLLISGSNMSGKSTLLRTVGVNTVLALAGGSVHAESLRLAVVQLGAAMRVNDSLQDGKSLFYAVVTRLKEIVDLADGTPPLLYLIDEILPGTNSHDRRLGAEAVLRSLVAKPTLGLVTTHDLALTAIAETFAGRALNLHFEDHLEDGRMSFDYRLRPGVVKKSNALELMKMIGLDVPLPADCREP